MTFFKLGKRRLIQDEDGAVTVDFVVLTAAIVTLGIVVMNILRAGIYDASSAIYSSLTSAIYAN